MSIAKPILSLAVPLWLWRFGIEHSDWAALALLALALMLWRGSFGPARDRQRAKLSVIIRGESPLSDLLGGTQKALIQSTAIACLLTPVLAWQVVSAEGPRLALLIGLSCLAACLVPLVRILLRRHLTPVFSRSLSRRGAALLAVLLVLPLLVWVDFALTKRPLVIQETSLQTALLWALEALPARGGPFLEGLSVLQAAEGLKLWLVMQFPGTPWPGLAFATEGALSAGAFATATVTLSTLFDAEEDQPENPTKDPEQGAPT